MMRERDCRLRPIPEEVIAIGLCQNAIFQHHLVKQTNQIVVSAKLEQLEYLD